MKQLRAEEAVMRQKVKIVLHAVLPSAFFLLTAAVMVGAAEILGEKEIIFPEAGAIALGALAAPRLAWRTDKRSVFFLIGICACAGVLIVLYLPLPLAWQLIAAYLFGQAVLLASRTTFAPLISAAVLPVLLQTRSPVYLAAALALTALVLLLRSALEGLGLRPRERFVPLSPSGADWADLWPRTLFAALLCLLAVGSGWLYLVCPPLLVAFTEFTRAGNRAMRTPARSAAFLALSAACGAVVRGVFCLLFGLPLALAAAAACAVVLALAAYMKLFLPPAAALALLAMLVPAEALAAYALQAAAGAALYTAFACAAFHPPIAGAALRSAK